VPTWEDVRARAVHTWNGGGAFMTAILFWTVVTVTVIVASSTWKDGLQTAAYIVQAASAVAIWRLSTRQFALAEIVARSQEQHAERSVRSALFPLRQQAWDRMREAMQNAFSVKSEDEALVDIDLGGPMDGMKGIFSREINDKLLEFDNAVYELAREVEELDNARAMATLGSDAALAPAESRVRKVKSKMRAIRAEVSEKVNAEMALS